MLPKRSFTVRVGYCNNGRGELMRLDDDVVQITRWDFYFNSRKPIKGIFNHSLTLTDGVAFTEMVLADRPPLDPEAKLVGKSLPYEAITHKI